MPTDGTGNAKVQRRLAAILAADIAGYSALMGADEEGTVQDLKGHQAVVLPMIGANGGRIIDTAGDGILAEFASVVNAVECAVAIQRTMTKRNAPSDQGRRMQFRIGINLGDVIHDEARVYGDGVNIAARLETIAQPGGICVSGAAYEQVHTKLPYAFTRLGDRHLKNIAAPVPVYRLELGQIRPIDRSALPLPDKPSIAVLPFANMSGDPTQKYFSDGITDDIITELSRFSELFVIARNSTFRYKGESQDIRKVGRELGVRYVLEGSIRRADERVRIAAKLIDTTTGAHRWAERYDRDVKDVFAVQDELARTIAALLSAHVNKAEAARTLLKAPREWEAYDFYIRGSEAFISFMSTLDRQVLYSTRRLAEQSFSIDPSYARAYALYSATYVYAWAQPLDTDHLSAPALDRAYAAAGKSVQMDPTLPLAHSSLGTVLIWKHDHDGAIAAFERATSLNPNFTDWRFAAALIYGTQFERAIEIAKLHMRLDPFYPPLATMWLATAYYMLKRYDDAVVLLRECVARAPNLHAAQMRLAATCAQLGDTEGAREALQRVLHMDPMYTLKMQRQISAFRDPAATAHFFDGLRKAGLPEG